MLGKPIRTEVLIDSGADLTMLDAGLAVTLGVNLATMPPYQVGGVGGAVIGRLYRLWLEICGRWILAPVVFAPNRSPQLLGRAAVFEQIDLAFMHRESLILASAA